MSELSFKSVIFDLDGVITKTASVHAKAWKEMFDEYLRMRAERDNTDFSEFRQEDYLTYVDGKPRYEGVKSFLTSRGIDIPFGDAKDSEDTETVCGLGNKKNTKFRQVLAQQKPQIYTSTVDLIRTLKEKGVRIGVASSSKNCRYILQAAGLEELFGSRVDGVVSSELGLQGKPEGDIFVQAAFHLQTAPRESVVVEDATSGVTAGRNGGFRLVIGIARSKNTQELIEAGADIVVEDMAAIDVDWIQGWFNRAPAYGFAENPHSKEQKAGIAIHPAHKRNLSSFPFGKDPVFFLDYDGTLTPIVDRPEMAVLSDAMREVVRKLSRKYKTAIVSGRMREDVENLVGIEGLFYAGSHGFDIKGPDFSLIESHAEATLGIVAELIRKLKQRLDGIEGLLVEEKKFSVAVHYRCVAESKRAGIKAVIDEMLKGEVRLRLMEGKMVYEILPAFDWNKGKAIRWIMKALDISWNAAGVVYIGDDVTDEDAFRVVGPRGTAILVSDQERPSSADFYLKSPAEAKKFFESLL